MLGEITRRGHPCPQDSILLVQVLKFCPRRNITCNTVIPNKLVRWYVKTPLSLSITCFPNNEMKNYEIWSFECKQIQNKRDQRSIIIELTISSSWSKSIIDNLKPVCARRCRPKLWDKRRKLWPIYIMSIIIHHKNLLYRT